MRGSELDDLGWVDWELWETLENMTGASPVLRSFCRGWNMTPDPEGGAIRERLRASLPRLIDTAGDALREDRRSWLARDWLIRVSAATWLRSAGLAEQAETLAHLPPQTSLDALHASATARIVVRNATRDAARDGILDTTSALAKGGDWYVVWNATSVGARGAAYRSAYADGRVAARAAAGLIAKELDGAAAQFADDDAATDAASLAGREAAWEALNAAAKAAGWDAMTIHNSMAARDVAQAAASAVLQPTIAELQAHAWQLLDALIACD